MDLKTSINFLSGLFTVLAYDDLSYGKKAIQTDRFKGYQVPAFSAQNALDRNVTTCTRTAIIGNTSPDKNVSWQVDLGGVYNIYSITILFKEYEGHETRQRGRFAGFSLFISNSSTKEKSTLCYKDGPLLPLLNFTATCVKQGRYVTFYNERVDSVHYPVDYRINAVYTELCEVIVSGCFKSGVYGRNCDTPCPAHCADNTCFIHNGTCLSCKPGWRDAICTTPCSHGWYGQDCEQRCIGYCKRNTFCNHMTGQCEKGCDVGWSGSFCNKECFESYGEDCKIPCSQKCYNNNCDRFNGTCLSACTNQFYGEKCDKDTKQSVLCSDEQNEASISAWVVGLIVSLTMNVILIVGISVSLWYNCSKNKLLPCTAFFIWKKSVYYTESETRTDEPSNYQELNISRDEIAYQNTTLH